jgi:hypothetical protein
MNETKWGLWCSIQPSKALQRSLSSSKPATTVFKISPKWARWDPKSPSKMKTGAFRMGKAIQGYSKGSALHFSLLDIKTET